MKNSKNLFAKLSPFLIIIFIVNFPQFAHSWGGRGHATICDVSTFLVKNPNLREFLTQKPHVMGYLCNIPDTYWRTLPSEQTQEGNPTHILDSDLIPLKIKDFPVDYNKLVQKYQDNPIATSGQIIRNFPKEFGSIWWRADQFFRLAIANKQSLQEPIGKKDEQSDQHPYNKAVYNFFVNLGVMGHFIGDTAQPLHNTKDYDGYEHGHGGLHGYYEDVVLSILDGNLHNKVLRAAQNLMKSKQAFLSAPHVVEKAKELSILSYADIDAIIKADRLKKPSELKEARGMKIKTPAERESISKTQKAFEPLIIKHLSRAASLLATLWDEAYVAAGSPDLKIYKSYKFPFHPEFVYPDYYDRSQPKEPLAGQQQKADQK